MSSYSIQAVHPVPMLLGESPLWHAEQQTLYWIDIPGKALHQLDTRTHAHQHWALGTEPGCIALHANGGIVIALRTGVVHFDPATGTSTPIAPPPYDPATMRFNDGRCDVQGRLWAGTIYEPRDKAGASLFSIAQGHVRDLQHPVTTSNGVAFSLDNTTLYHADTPAHRIMQYTFDPVNGNTSDGRIFAEFDADKTAPDYRGRPDGSAVDSEGAYWCAMFEGGRLLRLHRDGHVLEEIILPVKCPTMIAFGGEDLRTLYMTTASNNRSVEEIAQYPLSGCVLSLRVAVPGRVEYPYRA